jgi:hypothetical protein
MEKTSLFALMGLIAILFCPAAHAGGPQSAFFQTSGPHLVQRHIYYHERHTGPACTKQAERLRPCLGKNGLIVWG